MGHGRRDARGNVENTKLTPVNALNFYLNCFSSPSENETSMETDHLPQSVDTTFILDQTADGEFLSLDDLGKVLTHLASLGMIPVILSFKSENEERLVICLYIF